jgi:hypothetical protein
MTGETPIILDDGMQGASIGRIIVALGTQRHTFPKK